MASLGTPELAMIFIVAMVLFGVGRIGRLGTELGEGIRGFRRGVLDEFDEEKE
jgi:sec-independent protein translocase protein TatA